ncbi:MAG: tetratricopeptide repeat protein [Flavobacteriales bacterium]|jgi:hypothetical protein|nr:tetratricopeptide repeat protein [Flavobacteriales bacterium]
MKVIYLFLFCSLFNSICSQDSKLAERYFLDENFNAALNEYELLIQDDAVNIEYNFNLAICYLNTNGDKSRAIPYLERLVVNPKIVPDAWYLLGRAYHFGYQFDNAIRSYNKFIATGKGNILNRDDAPIQIEYCENAKELMKFPLNVTFENLGKNINSQFDDYYPFVTSNESYIMYNSNRNNSSLEKPNGSFYSNVYISEVENGAFQPSKVIKSFCSNDNSEEIVGLKNIGGKAIVFKSNLNNEGDLYELSFKNNEFGDLKKLDQNINTKYSEIAACVSDDESKLFFASDQDGGYGGIDLYLCQKLPNGKWSSPFNLGPIVNTESDEDFPNISPDGNTLYFSSKGHTSMGGYDIFTANWDETKKKFTGIQNIGYPINTPEDNMNFRISNNKEFGYISSVRKGGYGNLDLYRVKFNRIEPRYTVIKGILKNDVERQSLEDAYIQITDQETDEIYGDYAPNEITMRYVIILPPGKYYMYVSAEGHDEIMEELEIYDKASYKHEIDKDIILKSVSGQ